MHYERSVGHWVWNWNSNSHTGVEVEPSVCVGVLSCADGEAVPGRCLGLATTDGGWAEKKVWTGLCRQIHVLLFQVTRLKMGREGE